MKLNLDKSQKIKDLLSYLKCLEVVSQMHQLPGLKVEKHNLLLLLLQKENQAHHQEKAALLIQVKMKLLKKLPLKQNKSELPKLKQQKDLKLKLKIGENIHIYYYGLRLKPKLYKFYSLNVALKIVQIQLQLQNLSACQLEIITLLDNLMRLIL